MSDKSFGDHYNRNIVKNPLLSTAVTGLSIEDLTHTVLLPAAPSEELITRQEPAHRPQDAPLAQPGSSHDNSPSGDANQNTLHRYPPSKPNESSQGMKVILTPQTTQSKASAKSDDDFDVNEYFARLQGTRYVSAPLNSGLKEDPKATLEATEENLEEINLNEEKLEVQQSITADIASNFSQLPTVLPQMASVVFSSFSSMLSMKSREQTPDEPQVKPSGYEDVQIQAPGDSVPLLSVNEPAAPKEVAPPPTQPPIGASTNYRITTKKKAYAQIPGLSSTHHTISAPTNTTPYYNPDFIPKPTQETNLGGTQTYAIRPDEIPTQSNILNPVNLVPAVANTQSNLNTDNREYNVFNPLDTEKDIPQAVGLITQATENLFKAVQDEHSQNVVPNTPIIPPPPMFSNLQRSEPQSNVKSLLPPSVARRIGSNLIKPQTLATVNTESIFTPAPITDVSKEGFRVSIPYPLDSTLPVKDDKPPMGSQSAFVLFNAGENSFSAVSGNNNVPPIIPPPAVNTVNTAPIQIISPTKPPSVDQVGPSLFSTTYAPEPDNSATSQFFNPSLPAAGLLQKPPETGAQSSIYTPAPPQLGPPSTFFNPTQQVEPKPILQTSLDHSIQEPPKPALEPPKATGNLSYRMAKKKPQYYSGPIEGVGDISNNVKPTMPNFEPCNFQGALFTPNPQSIEPGIPNPVTAFDITQQTVALDPSIPAYTPFDLDPPQTNTYMQSDYNTAFDLSRPTTDNYEPPKQETKSFGIIGSLKSKLSSIDINKIQNSVTTFFDPAYNDIRKESNNEGVIGPSTVNYQEGSLDIFVPPSNPNSEPYSQNFGQYNYQNPYSYVQGSAYYPNQVYGYNSGTGDAQEVTYDSRSLFSAAHAQGFESSNAQTVYPPSYEPIAPPTAKPLESTNIIESEVALHVSPPTAVQNVSLFSVPNEVGIMPDISKTKENIEKPVALTNESVIPPDNFISRTIEIASDPFYNLGQIKSRLPNEGIFPLDLKENPTSSFFDSQQFFNKSQPFNSDILTEKLEILKITQEEDEGLPDIKTIAERIDKEILSTDINTPVDYQYEKTSDLFSNLPTLELGSPLDSVRSNEGMERFDNSDSIIGNCSLDTTSPEIPRLDAPTILFGLPSVPPKNAVDIDGNNVHDWIPQADTSCEHEDVVESEPSIHKCQCKTELSICLTCREVHKTEDKEHDVTTQLIENITSPIQLSNPVNAPFTDDKTHIEERSDIDSKQCDEITHITEETIETIQVQSASELLQDVDELINPNIRNYGWATETNTSFVQPDSLLEHDYSFQIDPNAIGFYGNNSLFFEDMPNNASDEIKAEFKNTFDEPLHVIQRQMSIPTAPPEEDEDDNKSDKTGVLDVHSIELDAKKDFPVYEEFVIEPSETDDDKIEYRERERSSEDPVQDVDSFTNRIERFKQMEEYTDKADDLFGSQKNLIFELNAASPSVPIASYFDTGNYAAEAHYKNLSSPSAFQVGSPNMPFSIPPGFEDEYKRKLSAMALQDEKPDKDENAPCIPDTSTQTSIVTTTTYSSSNTIANVLTTPSFATKPLEEITNTTQKLPEFSSIFGHKPESGDNLASSLFAKMEVKPVAKEPEVKPQVLQDPISFFSTKEEPAQESDGGFSRLASYFTTPAKTERNKPFFELSQSQNHFRHVTSSFDSGVSNSSIKTCQNQNQRDTSSLQNIPPNVYLANLQLMNDLTSPQNITFNNDQIVRTVNYFTVEYDTEVEVRSKIHGGDVKKIEKGVFEGDIAVDEKGVCDDANYVTVVTKCKFCCNSDFHRVITVNKVGLNSDFKVRKAMDDESNNDNNKNDRKAEMDPKQPDGRKEVTVNFGNPLEEDGERVSIVSENRVSSEYLPVKHHWFYRVDFEGKSTWRGFSAADNTALENAFLSDDLDENTVVATDGGRFDVNIVGRLRTPVYWTDKPTNVRRCSWFYKGTTDARYVPYTEAVAEKLEEEYRHGITTGEWHRRLVLPSRELVVLHGPAVMVHLAQPPDALASQPQSTMRPRVVRRGCDETEIEDTEPSSIDHLLLLCHGVGSACDMRFRSVEEVVDDFRATSLQLLQSHYRNSYDKGVVNRVEVLPISWHATLHSGETGVDRRLAAITLDSIPRLRNFTNDTVLDVLFYTSPVFCQTIIDTVCAELNRIYNMFVARNPSFAGRVSLGGHSLGSVILYDLLCHQRPESTAGPEPLKSYVQGASGAPPPVKYPALAFRPAALYALGSPIAMFECIRGVKSLGTDFCLPTCKNFFNIFHPYDPIAYRIEPLINTQLGSYKPYLIPHHKGRKRMHLELKDTMARVGADLKQKLLESLKSTWSSMWKAQPPPNDGQLEKVVEEEMEKEQLCEDNRDDLSQNNELQATPETLGVLNAGRRIDYVLQEAPFEMINEYLFAMSSHVCYWESEDTMLLILKEIYDALGVRPDCSVPQQSMTVHRTKNETINVATPDFPSTSREGT